MTPGSFELFEIQCSDFIRNLLFFQQDSRDQYVREMLEDMITNVRQYRKVIHEAVDTDEV